MTELRWLPALLFAVSLAVLGPARAQTGGGAPPAISDGAVKIGMILDMTGPFADVTGIGSATAARLAVEDFGNTVLGAPIELVIADHKDSPDRAAAIAREWFGAGHVDAVMDVSGSSEALIVQAIAATRNKIVSLSAPAAERLTNEACTATAIHYAFDTYATAHTVGEALVKAGGNSWFFITVDNNFGYDLEGATAAVVTANGGQVLGRIRHPLDIRDLSAYLLRARDSQAKVIALADSGTDLSAAIRQAGQLKMIPGPQIFAPLGLRFTGVVDLGVQLTQGMIVSDPFYWDLDDATRIWSRRFFERVHRMPNGQQAAVYSSTMHYLQAVARAGTDATEPVMREMRDTPIDDFFTHHGHIRADGLMVHDMHVFQVKTPAESRAAWDVFRLIGTIPGDQAFRPLAASRCPLVMR